ncbi:MULTISPECIES: cysteine hydrolase family protein [Kaistia]|uniref:Cysteine hydrolase n=1 Tax=Kaistia nematophila TaxID=2994654 RepID=A0A9X3E5W6_9HYPH|nr:isochorismatase family cysteine hydrolase [Kaistia nematophila]MCX5571932.1 cysteine hydrolase [Kaistia nematophila]
MTRAAPLDRHSPIDPSRTAILFIDTQDGIFHAGAETARPYFFRSARDVAIPGMARLLEAGRSAGAEIVFTVIESLTRDGRDRSLDYKQTNFHFAPGSPETRVIEALKPGDDEIILPKTSSSLFNSTIFEYLLRNIGIDTVIVTGFLTDQCVDHTVRDGADRGFRMICPTDACTTDSRERHDGALSAFKGYCRLTDSDTLIEELKAAQRSKLEQI